MQEYQYNHNGAEIVEWVLVGEGCGKSISACLAEAKAKGLTWDEATIPRDSGPAAALAEAEATGIELPFGGGTIRLLCGDKDRALFSSALTLYRTHEDLLPTEEAKAAFRASSVMLADAHGTPHTLTVSEVRQLLVMYGATYQALWSAAAGS